LSFKPRAGFESFPDTIREVLDVRDDGAQVSDFVKPPIRVGNLRSRFLYPFAHSLASYLELFQKDRPRFVRVHETFQASFMSREDASSICTEVVQLSGSAVARSPRPLFKHPTRIL
jgi:hypothetical protein